LQESYRKTARDTTFVGIANLIQSLFGFLLLPLLTKTLGAHDYGIWTQVNVTVSLILPFAGLGLIIALIRFLSAEKDKEVIQEGFYSVVSAIFLVSSVVSLVVIIFASPIAMNFFDGNVQVVRITAGIILLSSVNPVFLNLIRTFQQIKKYSIFIIAENCSQVGIITYLVLNGYGILNVVLSLLAVKVVILLILFFLIKSQIGIKKPNFSRIKEYLSFSLPLVPGGISSWLIRLSDRYVIGIFLGLTSVGIYSAAYNLGFLIYVIPGILSVALLPTLSKLYDESRMDEVRTHLSYVLKYSLAIAIPFVFGAAILAESVLRLFSTPEIASQGYLVAPLVALSALFVNINSIMSYTLVLAKKTKIIALIKISAAAVNIGLNILIVPRMGIIGAAITTLFVFLIAMSAISYFSFKEFKFSINWHFIVKSLVASVIMSLTVWLMAPQGYLYTILTVVAGVAVYGIGLILLRGFSKEEFKFFRGLLRAYTH